MKKNLLLLHGAIGSKKQFEPIKNLLSDRFKVYDFNFDGHGGKAAKSDFSIELFTANTLKFMEENNIAKSNLFGYSMGGYVGLNLASLFPERIEKIITLGTKFNWNEKTAAKEIKMLNPEKIEKKVPAFAKFLETTHHPNDWKTVLHNTAGMINRLGEKKVLSESNFKDIPHQTLIMLGSLDLMVTVEESTEVAEYLPNGYFKIIEDFEHPIEKVDPEKLAKVIIDFLDQEAD